MPHAFPTWPEALYVATPRRKFSSVDRVSVNWTISGFKTVSDAVVLVLVRSISIDDDG